MRSGGVLKLTVTACAALAAAIACNVCARSAFEYSPMMSWVLDGLTLWLTPTLSTHSPAT